MDNNQPSEDQIADLIKALGWDNLSWPDQERLLTTFFEILQARVGTRLSLALSDKQLIEYEKIMEQNDPKIATEWLEKAIPASKDILQEEFDTLADEIAKNNGKLPGDDEDEESNED